MCTYIQPEPKQTKDDFKSPLPQMVHSGWLIALDVQQRAEASPCNHFPVSMRVHRGTFKNKDDPRAFDGKSSPLRLLKGLKRGGGDEDTLEYPA